MTNKTPAKPSIGIVLRVALMVSGMFGPLARPHLKRRLAKGKEDPNRWREKLGETDAKRPDGPLIWLHGVGVGEVMALRGLIQHLAHERPELHFLVTSSARSSGTVFSHNLPPRTQHQYLPLDLPGPVARFLDFWRPDLAVWSDQEVWPRMAVTLARRGIAQAYVAARITKKSAKTKSGFGDGYGNLYRLLDLRHAQDDRTADAMRRLMGDDSTVHVTGSIKAAGAPLAHDPDVTDAFAKITTLRRTWLVASSHPADEAVALAAHALIRKTDPDALLIVAPRDICRADEIAKSSQSQGMTVAKRSDTLHPNDDIAVYIADTYGELGTWYRAAPIVPNTARHCRWAKSIKQEPPLG